MNILASLKSNFQTTFPRLASGNYVHFFVVRHSQSFPIFQTDGVLNTARTQAGLDSTHEMSRQFISRLVMFKRKQVTPERLTGRELLRSLNLTSATEGAENFCEYNGGNSCKKCPDCILYGFAIGTVVRNVPRFILILHFPLVLMNFLTVALLSMRLLKVAQ